MVVEEILVISLPFAFASSRRNLSVNTKHTANHHALTRVVQYARACACARGVVCGCLRACVCTYTVPTQWYCAVLFCAVLCCAVLRKRGDVCFNSPVDCGSHFVGVVALQRIHKQDAWCKIGSFGHLLLRFVNRARITYNRHTPMKTDIGECKQNTHKSNVRR